jgi:hypothetical protein
MRLPPTFAHVEGMRSWVLLAAVCAAAVGNGQTFDLEQFDQLFRPRLRVDARWTPRLAFEDVDAHYEDRAAVGVLTFPICKRWSADVDLKLRGESAGEMLKNAVRIRASQVMGNVRFGTRQLVLDEGTRTLHTASLGALGISLTKKYRILYWSANVNLSEEESTMDQAVPRFTGVIGKMHVKGLRKQFYYGLALAVSDGFNLPLPFIGGTVPMGDRWSFQYLLPAQLAFGCKASTNTRLLAGVGLDGYRSGFELGEDRVNINYTALRGFITVRHRLSRSVQLRAEVTGLPLHSIRLPDVDGELQRYGIQPGVQFMAGVNLFIGESTLERLLDDVLK